MSFRLLTRFLTIDKLPAQKVNSDFRAIDKFMHIHTVPVEESNIFDHMQWVAVPCMLLKKNKEKDFI
jgi:hypothetical protein